MAVSFSWLKRYELYISLSSLLISLIVLWITILSPAKIVGKMGKSIALATGVLTTKGVSHVVPLITTSLTLANEGAQTGIIEDVMLRVYIVESQKYHLFKPTRETKAVMIQTKPDGEADIDAQMEQLVDVFSPFVLTPKTAITKKFSFFPFIDEKIPAPNLPFKLTIEVLIRSDDDWEVHDQQSFLNPFVDFNKGTGWAILDSEESKSYTQQLLRFGK